MSMEDLIEEEDVVVTISHLGYIKRTSATEYQATTPRRKRRQGKQNTGRRLYRTTFCCFHASYFIVLYRKGKMFLAESIRNYRRR